MKRLNEEDIKQIERFMKDNDFDRIDYMLACFKRLHTFAKDTYDGLYELNNKGDLN